VRKLLIVAVVIVAGLMVALAVLRIVGLDPHERRAGLWLRGDPVTEAPADWSFTDKYQTIFLQTRAWYGLPHSVTTTCVVSNGHLYLTSVYRQGFQFPRDRLWNKNVMRDPRVRLKIGTRLYDGTLALVTDPAEKSAVLDAKAKKYPRLAGADRSRTYVFRLTPG
jgi:hypothetical protein